MEQTWEEANFIERFCLPGALAYVIANILIQPWGKITSAYGHWVEWSAILIIVLTLAIAPFYIYRRAMSLSLRFRVSPSRWRRTYPHLAGIGAIVMAIASFPAFPWHTRWQPIVMIAVACAAYGGWWVRRTALSDAWTQRRDEKRASI
ncbi:MAG: hypothetical protein ACRER3_00330 [Pseudomonas fluorescens]